MAPLEEPPRPTVKGVAQSLLIAVAVVGVSAGLGKLAPSGMGQPLIIFGVTTLGILLSFLPRLRRTAGAYETGEYMLLVFSGAVGSVNSLSIVTPFSLPIVTPLGVQEWAYPRSA